MLEDNVSNAAMKDEERINSFTIFQALLIGYYYGVFIPLVDTTSLEVQSINRAWGFRQSTS